MTCRHKAGDPNCSSYSPPPAPRRRTQPTPDATKYEILDACRSGAQQAGPHLLLKVKYPNCSKCAYEGTKLLVYLNVTEVEAIKWKRIDPHFADPSLKRIATEAPTPAARFPASDDGWQDALNYMTAKEA